MAIPTYGAAPLAKTFILLRSISLVALFSIVGITANFVAEIIHSNISPPTELIGTLVVTSTASLYCLVSIPFFWAKAKLGLWIMTGIDIALLLAFAIVAVLLGRPISFLNCAVVNDSTAAAMATSVYDFTQSLSNNLGQDGSTIGLGSWAGYTKMNCYETKALWGLCISLCILLSCTAMILPSLWWKSRRSSVSLVKSNV